MQQGLKLQDTREIRRALILAELKRRLGEKYKKQLNLAIKPLKGRLKNRPKVNCWEFMQCGREPGGEFVDELGVCPASNDPAFEGINDGEKGGRACWAVSGTLCLCMVHEGFSSKQCECERCDFYKLVQLEEGDNFLNTRKIRQRYIHRKKELHLCKYPERKKPKKNHNSSGVIILGD
jgi:hypothetical protein